MRILLISCHFAPFNSIGSIRPTQTARVLATRGHDVRVLTVADQPYSGSLPFPDVLTGRVTFVPYHGIERVVEWLVGERTQAGPAARSRRQTLPTFVGVRQWLKKAYRSVFRFPDRYGGWIRGAVREGKLLIAAWKPDVIVATYPPLSALHVGSRLSAWANVPWVADFRDVDSYRKPGAEFQWRNRIDRLMEKRLLRNVAGMTAISPPLTEAVQKLRDVPCEVIANGWDADSAKPDPDDHWSSPFLIDRVNIVYTGRGYPGNYDIRPLFGALATMKDADERFAVWMFGRALDEYAIEAARFGLSSIVHVSGSVNHAECRRLQRAADVLLLLQWTAPGVDGIIPAKFYEYVAAARPILAVGPADRLPGTMIRDRGLGISSSAPAEIAAWLRDLQCAKARLGKIPGLPAGPGADLSREIQVHRFESFLCRIVEQPKRAGL